MDLDYTPSTLLWLEHLHQILNEIWLSTLWQGLNYMIITPFAYWFLFWCMKRKNPQFNVESNIERVAQDIRLLTVIYMKSKVLKICNQVHSAIDADGWMTGDMNSLTICLWSGYIGNFLTLGLSVFALYSYRLGI